MARSAVAWAFGGTNLARSSNRTKNAPIQTSLCGTPFSSSSHCNYICVCTCTNSNSNAYCSDSPSSSNPVTSAGENTGTSRSGSVNTHSTHE